LCFVFNSTRYENVIYSFICHEIWTKSKKENTDIDFFLLSDIQSSTRTRSSSFTLLAVLFSSFACISLYFSMIEQFTSCISWEDSFMQRALNQFIDDRRWIIRRVRSLSNFLWFSAVHRSSVHHAYILMRWTLICLMTALSLNCLTLECVHSFIHQSASESSHSDLNHLMRSQKMCSNKFTVRSACNVWMLVKCLWS